MAEEHAALHSSLFVTGDSEQQSLTYAKLVQHQQAEQIGGYAPVFRRSTVVATNIGDITCATSFRTQIVIPTRGIASPQRSCPTSIEQERGYANARTSKGWQCLVLTPLNKLDSSRPLATQVATEKILQNRNYYYNLVVIQRGVKEANQLADIVEEKSLSALTVCESGDYGEVLGELSAKVVIETAKTVAKSRQEK